MTAVHAAMNLGGPFLSIALAVRDGADTIPLIKRAVIAPRRRGVGRNVNVMLDLGLLAEEPAGRFSLTPKCLAEMPSHRHQSPLP